MEFFCYAYGRLSKEDLDKKTESDSIKNQRDLIHAYIDRDPELHLVMEGYDDGYTGTSFDRPYVREMLEAVKSGKVNCVVVKDDCVIIELNAESPIKCWFCAVSSIF
ncbi:hypothetical protein D7V91_16605 [bacterium 1xD42-67]|nr:hypothetical protein D7V91_16605 [bacterium 1xD42-67]